MTREPGNIGQVLEHQSLGPVKLGPWTSHVYRNDPRRMAFVFSRYKFVSKMLAGMGRVLEVGCGDGIGVPLVLQTVGEVHAVDFEPIVLEGAAFDRAKFSVHDMTERPVEGHFDAAYSLDVIEHVAKENRFLDHICASLVPHGVLIIGTPNVNAAEYASKESQAGHINLHSAESLRAAMAKRFHNVFSFGMNDEVVHTGFSPMCHYLFAIGVGRKP